MKITIDARWIFPEISGIGSYTRELIRHLALLDKKNAYILLFNNKSVRDRTVAELDLDNSTNFTTKLLTYSLFSIRNQFLLPGVLTRECVDVFHSANYMIPFLVFPRHRTGKIKCVATVHDVIPMIFPEHVPRSKKAKLYPLYRRLMIKVGARSDAIIADSRASRIDIIKHLHIPASSEHKVRAIYCGVSERFHPSSPVQSAIRNLQSAIPKTILYVGRLDPYKNLTTLIKAFAKARKTCPFPINITVAGSPDPRYPEASLLARELGIESSIKWTGYVSDEELVSLYQHADLLVHPSRYEGFGLQVVEAMACGTPVICSIAGSLPEVAGDAAIMLDPDDISGLTEKITQVLSNRALAKEMSQKGLRQAAKFTWSQTAKQTLQLYNELCANGDPKERYEQLS